ncbi:unnamed protein product [Rangifer tarandus platyrhynchus]|uniref:Uncharacterized protein n=1 Tax=Rangifer tarandus platyrhynchus TaxID=3082113 RepID=A0AC59YTI7_RANTA
MRAAQEGQARETSGFCPRRPLHRAAEGLLCRHGLDVSPCGDPPALSTQAAVNASPRPRPHHRPLPSHPAAFLLLPEPDPRAFAQPSASEKEPLLFRMLPSGEEK